jgi:hypothetical protein
MRPLCLLILSVAAFAQRPVTWEERPGVELANDKVALTVLTTGGAMVDFLLRDDPEKLSPMWNPIRMAREAGQQPRFGSSMGHFLCVDGFGNVSKEERAAGMPGHGEAHTLPWETVASGKQGKTLSIQFTVKLPLVQEILNRTIRLVDGENVVYVESEIESLVAFDRPLCWAEHATIGSPFLEPGKTVVDMSASRAKTRTYKDQGGGQLRHRFANFQDFTWPNAPGINGETIDIRAAPTALGFGDHTTCLMDPSRRLVWVTALHPEKRLLLGYIFRREEFPWTQNWENYPPNGKLARGLEFSTMPFDVPRREAVSLGTMFDTPTYRWLPAKSKVASYFLMFLTRTPEGMRKIDDVTLDGGRITIEDRAAGKRVSLAASLPGI